MRLLHVRDSVSVFAALGDETRLQIVARLCKEGPASIVRLSEGFAMSRQAITKHLHVLEGAGLVRGSRPGRESVWELLPERLDVARASLDQISAEWDAALGRLKDFVEK
ncbi:ArsR/SmtB family transcription factor [Chondromyces apiculatus]|uniref:Transcriptional regulator, ArsR family n=1 Tax=Chondromyces apiculatus DSM 436 TaxID=1192034 RepID=A0A017TG33_9BACT|nr:metalloregulator ArsR/SmtB family transcription factor [Chondromyces apiculatus]EYF08258.1 transcriptional regulator, ArsR family [Chondromyces apiculatus DSM 436]